MSANQLKQVVTGATGVAKKPTTINGFLETYKSEIARALPKHMTADRMARIALTEFRKTPALMKCDPATLFGAVIQCAQLGLEPGGTMGHAYLIPFENRKKGTTDVQFIVGYRGMIDLARRSGQIVSLTARAVHANDKFSYRFGLDETIEHVPFDGDSGPLTHVYAVAKLKDGGVQFEVLNKRQIEEIRNESQGYKTAVKYNRTDSPWIAHFEEMAKKTAIRRLFKYLPVSIELSRAVGLDEQGEAGISQDNEFVIDGISTHIDSDVDEGANTQDSSSASAETSSAQAAQGGAGAAASNPSGDAPVTTFAQVEANLRRAKDTELLDLAADLIGEVADPGERAKLAELYKALRAKLGGAK